MPTKCIAMELSGERFRGALKMGQHVVVVRRLNFAIMLLLGAWFLRCAVEARSSGG